MFCIGSSLLVASGYYWVLFQCLRMEKTKTSVYVILQWNSLVYSLCFLVSPQGVFSPLFSFECGLKISFLILLNWSLTVTAFRSVGIHRCYGYIGHVRILQSSSFDVYLHWTSFVLLPNHFILWWLYWVCHCSSSSVLSFIIWYFHQIFVYFKMVSFEVWV